MGHGISMDTGGIEIGDDAVALIGELIGELVESSGEEIGVDELIAALDSDSYEIGAPRRGGGAMTRGGGGGGRGGGMAGMNPAVAAVLAAHKAKKTERKAIAGRIADKFARGSTAVKPSVPIDSYAAVMNFRSTVAVPALGGLATVFDSAIETFKPTEVSLPVEIGPDFLIVDVSVGMRKIFASNGPLRASLLQSTAISKDMFDGITVQRGQPVTWIVQNTSGAPKFFEVTLFGKTVIMGGGVQSGGGR